MVIVTYEILVKNLMARNVVVNCVLNLHKISISYFIWIVSDLDREKHQLSCYSVEVISKNKIKTPFLLHDYSLLATVDMSFFLHTAGEGSYQQRVFWLACQTSTVRQPHFFSDTSTGKFSQDCGVAAASNKATHAADEESEGGTYFFLSMLIPDWHKGEFKSVDPLHDESFFSKPKMVNAPEGLNQVILRKVQIYLTKKVAKTFATTHYKLPFINANNFRQVCFLLHCHLDEKAL